MTDDKPEFANEYPYRFGQAMALIKMLHETLEETRGYPNSLKASVKRFVEKERQRSAEIQAKTP